MALSLQNWPVMTGLSNVSKRNFLVSLVVVFWTATAWANQASLEDFNELCITDGEEAVAHVLSLMGRSEFHGAYAQFLRDQRLTEFVAAEHLANQGKATSLSPAAIAFQKANFIDQQIRAQVAEQAAGYFSDFDPSVSWESSEEFSSTELEMKGLEPMATLSMAYLLLKKLREKGFKEIAEMDLGPSPPSLRSRICLMATHILVGSLHLTPLSIVRDTHELGLVMLELERRQHLYGRMISILHPELESRWGGIPTHALDSFRRKYDWYMFLQSATDRGELPRYVRGEAQARIFRDLVNEELESLRQLLGLNEAEGTALAIDGLVAKTAPSGIEKDQKNMDLWHARMEREISRQLFAGHKLILLDLWGPFVEKAILDYPHIIPCEMRNDCKEGSSKKAVYERKGRAAKLRYEKEFYEGVYRVLAEVEHPYVMPVMVKIAELDLDRVPDWVRDMPFYDEDARSQASMHRFIQDHDEKLEDYFYPQRAALFLLAFNLRWFPNSHLEMLKQWSVEQTYALLTQCNEQGSLCHEDRALGVVVNDFLDKYSELHALASSVAQMRKDHEQSYYEHAWDASHINDGTIYPLPTLDRETELSPTTWSDEVSYDEPIMVNHVEYFMDKLESSLVSRDLLHTPHRVFWFLQDNPGMIPVMGAVLIVFGGISMWWTPFIYVIDVLFVASISTQMIVVSTRLVGAKNPKHRDSAGKHRGLRGARSRIDLANQAMWVVPFIRPIGKRYIHMYREARRAYSQMRDYRKACELLKLRYDKPHLITVRTVRNALRDFQAALHPDRFVNNPALQSQNVERLDELLKAADFLKNLLTSRGAALKARIPTSEPDVMKAYQILKMRPGTSLAHVQKRLALRQIRIEALKRAVPASEKQKQQYMQKAKELESAMAQARAAEQVLARVVTTLEAGLTAGEVRGRILGLMIKRFVRSKPGQQWKPSSEIVETNPLLLPEYSSVNLNFPVSSIRDLGRRIPGAA